MPTARRSIILIGPARAGKSTVAALLADRLGWNHVPMDTVRFEFYREIGYDEEVASKYRREGGFWPLYRYWKPFEVHAVERVLSLHPRSVIDFGAGHSVFEDEELFARVQAALADFPNVFLLLPDPDIDRSLRILLDRDPRLAEFADGFTEHCLKSPCNAQLARHVIYTEGLTAAATCEAILDLADLDESLPTRNPA